LEQKIAAPLSFFEEPQNKISHVIFPCYPSDKITSFNLLQLTGGVSMIYMLIRPRLAIIILCHLIKKQIEQKILGINYNIIKVQILTE